MDGEQGARERLIAFRRMRPPAPRLRRKTLEVRGGRLAVYSSPTVTGRPPLLCVNGGLLFSHETLWPALAPLADRRQLILYDQRGRGESENPPDPSNARIEHDAADVRALRLALGISRWDLLGHSWGGGIALLAAELDQPGVRSVVTVGSVGPTSRWMADHLASALDRLRLTDRPAALRFSIADLIRPDPATHSAYSRAIYPAWFASSELAHLFLPPRTSSVTGAAVAARLWRDGYDWTGLLRALGRPALVIHGEEDLLPAGEARALVAALPDARLALLAGSGHMPFWEAPQPFFSVIEAFLSSMEAPA